MRWTWDESAHIHIFKAHVDTSSHSHTHIRTEHLISTLSCVALVRESMCCERETFKSISLHHIQQFDLSLCLCPSLTQVPLNSKGNKSIHECVDREREHKKGKDGKEQKSNIWTKCPCSLWSVRQLMNLFLWPTDLLYHSVSFIHTTSSHRLFLTDWILSSTRLCCLLVSSCLWNSQWRCFVLSFPLWQMNKLSGGMLWSLLWYSERWFLLHHISNETVWKMFSTERHLQLT